MKNYKDFVYQTNQSLQNLNQSIVQLYSQYEKLMNKFGSDRTNIQTDFYNLEESVLQSCKECKSLVNDNVSRFDALLVQFNNLSNDFRSNYLNKTSLNQIFYDLDKKDIDNSSQIKMLKDYFQASLAILESKLMSNIDSVRSDLTPKKLEIDPIESAISESLKVVYVDFAGLTRELELLKKSNAYSQKKFEDIYTLIGRIKEGK
jgi:hypothetical protein